MDPVIEQRARVLWVGAGERARDVASALARPGDLLTCSHLDEAVSALRDVGADLVIAEWSVEDAGARDALASAVRADPTDARWLVLTDSQDSADRDGLCAEGVAECLPEATDRSTLLRVARRLLEDARLQVENRFLRETIRVMEDCRPLANCLEPGQLYPMCLDLLMRATGRTRGIALFRREAAVSQSDAVALRGLGDEQATRLCQLLQGDKAVDLDAFHGIGVIDRGPLHEALRAADISVGTLLVVSFGGEGRESGVVVLFDDGKAFNAEDVERADIVARHGISALANAGTYAMAKERAFVDDVTNAYNARYLLSTVENEIQRAERYGNPLSILFLDLDRFKNVNDEYGHLIGSETLRRLSRLLEQCVRNVDTLARYGGDEFTIVLVDTDHDAAMRIAERIRQTVAGHPFEVGRDARLALTISIGVATCPDHGASRDDLLDAADKAMYRAKSEGRNRVCSAQEL